MRVFFHVAESSQQEQNLLKGFSIQTWLIPAFHFTTQEELLRNLRALHEDRDFREPDDCLYRQLIVEGDVGEQPNRNGAYLVVSTQPIGYYYPAKDQMEPFVPDPF
jgi:hypothetical protein